MARSFSVKSVAIIGAGPSGLSALKYLLAEKVFDRIDVYEQRARVGGIWDYSPAQKTLPEDFSVPSVSPQTSLPKPTWLESGTRQALGRDVEEKASFMSPLYDRLETNIPRTLMGFQDLDWPDCQLFPKHETVTQYLESYAADVQHLIQFNTQVLDVSLAGNKDNGQETWSVKTQQIKPEGQGEVKDDTYDAVVVASGHFNVPYIPKIKGIKEWSEKYTGAISHSMYFKRPEDYSDLKVVVVGNGASGIDIAMQIMTACKLPLLQSQKSEAFLLTDPSPKKQERPEIVKFILEDKAVLFADGTVEKNVDVVLFCTGYFYSFPFLNSLNPPLISDGTHVENLYQHMIYRPRPTLAFPVLQQRVIPFPMSQAQGAVISRLWAGRLSLPSEADMKAWEEKLLQETGGGRDFHLLKFPKDADYINAMYDWAMEASDAEIKGKKPPRWGEKEYWMREQFPAIKKAFQDRGEARHQVKTLEELGFDFERYKKERVVEQKSLL